MNRRHILLSSLGCCFAGPALAQTPPWSAQLLQGGFDGSRWIAGLAITLQPNWKTYWRVPGDGGIAPQIEISGKNVGEYGTLYPVPQRFESEAGSVIGYKDFVVFPLAITPHDPLLPLRAAVKAFMGVCDEVCIPAQFEAALTFDPGKAQAPDQALISDWVSRIPTLQKSGPVVAAKVDMLKGKPAVTLTLSAAVTDVFVEAKPIYYFGKPVLGDLLATLQVNGAKSADELKGVPLRVTLADGAKGLEQLVTVS